MLKNKSFVVSCQALEGEELYGGHIMTKMAQAAINGGANAIRASQIENIVDMLQKLPNVPIIGLIKEKHEGSDVFITPTIKTLQALIDSKVHVIAIDATGRKRPYGEKLSDLVRHFARHKQPHQKLMADCATLEDIANADALSFDYIGTTLCGYTAESKGDSNWKNDFAFLKKARQLTKKYLIAEGNLDTPSLAGAAMEIADAIVVGSAITRPRYITTMFAEQIRQNLKESNENRNVEKLLTQNQ